MPDKGGSGAKGKGRSGGTSPFPGVFMEGVSSGTKPIEGVGTAMPALEGSSGSRCGAGRWRVGAAGLLVAAAVVVWARRRATR